MTIPALWNESWTAALVNHLWQSTVVVGMAWLLAVALRKNHARARYWVWMAASVKFLAPFSLLIAAGEWLRSLMATPVAVQPAVARAMEQVAQPFSRAQAFASTEMPSDAHHASWLPVVLLAVWACGALVVALRFGHAWWNVYAAKRAARPIDVAADVPVLCSAALMEPGILGIARPALLLPEGIFDRLTAEQLSAIVAHEMCHVRRRDNLTFAIHMIVEASFWFYPLVWWIGARLIDERERACDEAVLQAGSEAEVYAEGLLNVCMFYMESPLKCVAGISGSALERRIVKIMAAHGEIKLGIGRKLLLAAMAIAGIFGPLAAGLSTATHIRAQLLHATDGPAPSFEVATIKPAKPEETHLSFRLSPAYFNAWHASLKDLLKFAYDVKSSDQIIGGPPWMANQFFDIEAKAGPRETGEFRELPPERKMNPTRLMVQSLLAERFRMTASFKFENLPAYVLVIAKGGPKLKPGEGYLIPAPGAVPPPPPAPGAQRSDGLRLPTFTATGAHQLTGKGVPINMLVGWLVFRPELGGRTVVDETGLHGSYDFVLDGVNLGPPQLSDAGIPPVDEEQSIFTILQEQLGLKLEPRKAPIEVLVIDHVERPSPN